MAGYQTEDSGRKIRRQRYKQAHVYMSRSEEHTSELQSQSNLVCRLLLEKKKKNKYYEEIAIQNTEIRTHLTTINVPTLIQKKISHVLHSVLLSMRRIRDINEECRHTAN